MFCLIRYLDNVLENAACYIKGQMTSNHLFYSMSQINFYRGNGETLFNTTKKKITMLPWEGYFLLALETQDGEHFFYNFKSKFLNILGHVNLCYED